MWESLLKKMPENPFLQGEIEKDMIIIHRMYSFVM